MNNSFDLFVGLIQMLDFELNINQTSNDVLFKQLQHQDNDYLEKIVKQNEKIIEQNEEILKILLK